MLESNRLNERHGAQLNGQGLSPLNLKLYVWLYKKLTQHNPSITEFKSGFRKVNLSSIALDRSIKVQKLTIVYRIRVTPILGNEHLENLSTYRQVEVNFEYKNIQSGHSLSLSS